MLALILSLAVRCDRVSGMKDAGRLPQCLSATTGWLEKVEHPGCCRGRLHWLGSSNVSYRNYSREGDNMEITCPLDIFTIGSDDNGRLAIVDVLVFGQLQDFHRGECLIIELMQQQLQRCF